MQRIWALLTAEISEEQASSESSTKLVNLADEVVRARNLAVRLESTSLSPSSDAKIDATEETRLRSAVERTLQPSDPVFMLLQKRLLVALAERLIQSSNNDAQAATVPERMQTGRERDGGRAGKRPRLMVDPEDMRRSEQKETVGNAAGLVVKGFEDPVLVAAVGDAFGRIRRCVEWVEETWGDLVESSDSSSME
jgi:hypothetical protein